MQQLVVSKGQMTYILCYGAVKNWATFSNIYMSIVRNNDNEIAIWQSSYVDKMLQLTEISIDRDVKTPMATSYKESISDTANYLSMVELLNYLPILTIRFIEGTSSIFRSNSIRSIKEDIQLFVVMQTYRAIITVMVRVIMDTSSI